jgi:peptide/nickel transport system substrate-binding protein
MVSTQGGIAVKKTFAISLVLLFAFAVVGVAQEIKNPDTLIHMAYGTLNSMDPAYVYDTDSGGLIFQVYENLFRWPVGVVDGTTRDLNYSLADADLIPMLATIVPTVDNGLVVEFPDGKIQYTVPIRTGTPFHEGGTLTAEDVEYTFERGCLQDRSGGPQWMFIEAFTGLEQWSLHGLASDILGRDVSRDDMLNLTADEQAQVYDVVGKWVEVTPDGVSVTFTLDANYPPFLGMLGHGASWGAILDKEWVIENGGWDGAGDTWAAWYNPGGGSAAEASELYDIANGTGPYKLVVFDPGVERVYERFDGYWRDPAPLGTVIRRSVQEWTDRFLAFENKDADIVSVDPQYVPQVEALDGVIVHKNLPSISMNPVGFFVTDIVMEGNDLVGDGQWGEGGIPSEFFNDRHVRRGFSFCMDYDLFIQDSYGAVGGFKTHGPIPQAFDWAYNPDPDLLYSVDLEAAEQEFMLAHDGRLWDEGFQFTLVYNEGNDSRRSMAEMMEINIESLNPKFHVELLGMPWTNQLDYLVTGKLPFFIIGWIMDYPDPHNFAQPFCHSGGTFGHYQGHTMVEIFEEHFDPVIDAAMRTTDQTERQALYYQVSELANEYAVDIWLPQVNGYRVVRDYIKGWAFNPAFPDVYYYSIDKTY